MVKIIYHIDDVAYLRAQIAASDVPEEKLDDLFADLETFRAVYTLSAPRRAHGTCPDHYTLTDEEGNKININDLNGYQRGCILSACQSHFAQIPPENSDHNVNDLPFGVVRIEQEEI